MLRNKLIKDNRLTFSILAISVVISFAVFVYVIMQVFEWTDYKEETEKARQEVESLNNKKPSPSRENERRIKEDTAVYTAKVNDLALVAPLQPAVDKFFEVLKPARIEVLDKKEIEKYKVPGTGIKADPKKGIAAVPAEIRKFTQREFCDFFRNRFEKYCKEEHIKNQDRKYLYVLTGFLSKLRSEQDGIFPTGNWDQAVDAFVREAKKATLEPIDNATKVSVLLSAIGFERAVPKDDIAPLQKYIDDMQTEIKKYAAAGKLTLTPTAELFIGGGRSEEAQRSSDGNGYKPENYSDLIFHWDVFGDIVKRLCKAEISTLRQVVVRARKRSDDKNAGVLDLKSSFENVGDYRVAHYTVVVSGKMSAIRAAVRSFDEASKENRLYVVRSICLYAKEDGAAKLMGQLDGSQQFDNADTQESDAPAQVQSRRSRRSRRNVANQDSDEAKKADEEQIRLAREAKLPMHKRSDYGLIQIGGEEECVAYIDIDYIVIGKKK